MSYNLIPVVALFLLIIFAPSAPKDSAQLDDIDQESAVEETGSDIRIDGYMGNIELDRQAIYKYIRHHYKRIDNDEADRIATALVQYGYEHKIDPKFTAALIARESSFNKFAVSSSGAKGLGQIKDMNFRNLGIEDPYNVSQNVRGTTRYMKNMMGIWKDRANQVWLALGSYFQGPGNIKRNGGQLDSHTRGYIQDIIKQYNRMKSIKDQLRAQPQQSGTANEAEDREDATFWNYLDRKEKTDYSRISTPVNSDQEAPTVNQATDYQ